MHVAADLPPSRDTLRRTAEAVAEAGQVGFGEAHLKVRGYTRAMPAQALSGGLVRIADDLEHQELAVPMDLA